MNKLSIVRIAEHAVNHLNASTTYNNTVKYSNLNPSSHPPWIGKIYIVAKIRNKLN